jgi:hypothetical protein
VRHKNRVDGYVINYIKIQRSYLDKKPLGHTPVVLVMLRGLALMFLFDTCQHRGALCSARRIQLPSAQDTLSWLLVPVVLPIRWHALVGCGVEVGPGLVEIGGCGKEECGERAETHNTSVCHNNRHQLG